MESHPGRVRPRVPTAFVGRDDECAALHEAVGRAQGGRCTAVVVTGPGGIGKTRLVQEALATAHGAARVLSCACPAEGGSLASPGLVEQVMRQVSPGDSGADADVERRARVVVERLRAAARSRPLVVVLEDLHWADTTTLEFVGFAAHALASEPVLLVVTHRDGHHVTPGLRRVLSALERRPGTTRLWLGPLPQDHARALVQGCAGDSLEREEVDRVIARASGVTLFLEELASHAATATAPRVPPSLRDVLLDRLAGVSAPARELLEVAVVCGPTFHHDLLAQVADRAAPTLEYELDELLDVGALEVLDDGTGYRFRHELLHEAVGEGIRPMRRRRLHDACAKVLVRRPDLASGGPADLARRWALAGRAGLAYHAHLHAADDAEARGAHVESAQFATLAHRWLRRVPEHERTTQREVDALVRIAASADRAGDHAAAARRYREALGVIAADDVGRAALVVGLVRSSYLAGDVAGAAAAALRGVDDLSANTPVGDRAVLVAQSAVFLPVADDPRAALRRVEDEALPPARRLGDPAVLCDVLSMRGLALARHGDARSAMVTLDEAERFAAGLADPRAVLRPAVYRLLALHGSGETAAVLDRGRDTMLRADRLGVARGVGQQVRTVVADGLVALGAWDEASEVLEEGLAWGGDGLSRLLLLLVRVDLAVRRGHLHDAERDLAEVREQVPEGHFRASLAAAELAWWRRNVVASARHALDGLAMAGMVADPDEFGRLAHALVRARSAGARAPAGTVTTGEVVELLAGRAGHPVADAWAATVSAVLAGAGDGDAWEAASARWRELARTPMVAQTCWHAGVAHLAAGDRVRGHARLQEAADLADELGATVLALEVRAARTAAGPPPPSGPSTSFEPDLGVGGSARHPRDMGLTPRQVEVLALVARGWTNRRIGEELGITERTTGTHVSRILHRLGVATRGEAAAEYHRTTAPPPA